jgi:hypothetical protein
MPMSRASNLLWRKKSPAHFIQEQELNYDSRADLWNSYFIDRESFELLKSSEEDPGGFWEKRGKTIALEIVSRMKA